MTMDITKNAEADDVHGSDNVGHSVKTAVLRGAGVVMALIALVLLPFVLSRYNTFQAALILTNVVALVGLNLVTGYAGQISIGHGAFYAIGAYVTAILTNTYGLPYWCAVPLSIIPCFLIGFAIGIPALRLEGHYLALATFSLAVAVPQLLKSEYLSPITNGVQGIKLAAPKVPAWVPLNIDQWLYFFCLACCIAMLVFALNLVRGKIGRALIAIRDFPVAAEAMGINISFVKATTFAISAVYAGVAGGMATVVVRFVAPDSFDMFLSISFLVGIVVGGLSTILGNVIGAIFILMVPDLVQDVSKAAPWAIYGVLLILFVILLPRGLWGEIKQWASRLVLVGKSNG
jgi:branched-chain amino acid transport system permease protein